jgi:hypothetical protein
MGRQPLIAHIILVIVEGQMLEDETAHEIAVEKLPGDPMGSRLSSVGYGGVDYGIW